MQIERQYSKMVKNLGSGFKFLAQPLCELGQVALPLCAQLIWKMSIIKVLTSQDYSPLTKIRIMCKTVRNSAIGIVSTMYLQALVFLLLLLLL